MLPCFHIDMFSCCRVDPWCYPLCRPLTRYMPGLAEGLEGVKADEMREIRVTFPDRLGPEGGDLEGTKAIFEVEAVEVKVGCVTFYVERFVAG